MAGILSKGIKLGYAASGEGPFTDLTNLQEIPEIGNGAKEKIETTVLSDATKMYIAGLGDSGQDLSFKFLYEKAQFTTLAGLEKQFWQVELPDATKATFEGTPSVKIDGVGTNAPITYTLTVLVESEITFA